MMLLHGGIRRKMDSFLSALFDFWGVTIGFSNAPHCEPDLVTIQLHPVP